MDTTEPTYLVSWHLNVNAPNPKTAAARARALQSPGTQALSFNVTTTGEANPQQTQITLSRDTIFTIPELLATAAGLDLNNKQLLNDTLLQLSHCADINPELLGDAVYLNIDWSASSQQERTEALVQVISSNIMAKANELLKSAALEDALN